MSKLFDNLIWVVIAIFIVFLILLGYKATTMFKKEAEKTENPIRPYEGEEDKLYDDEIGEEAKNEIDYSELSKEEETIGNEQEPDRTEEGNGEEELEKEVSAEVKAAVKVEKTPRPTPTVEAEKKIAPIEEVSSIANYKYLVIAGSFKSKENAMSEMKKFERKGFDPELVQFKNSSLYSISMGKFKSTTGVSPLIKKLKASGIPSYMHRRREK